MNVEYRDGIIERYRALTEHEVAGTMQNLPMEKVHKVTIEREVKRARVERTPCPYRDAAMRPRRKGSR